MALTDLWPGPFRKVHCEVSHSDTGSPGAVFPSDTWLWQICDQAPLGRKIPVKCPRPVVLTDLWAGPFREENSSQVPPPRGFQLSAPAPWFWHFSEGEALGIVIPVECPRSVDCMIVVYETFFLERLRDFKFSVPPQGGIWLIMTILTQYLSSNLVPPPHRNSS